MKTLYLDCSMGVAGDMFTAALLDLLPDSEEFIEEFNNLEITDVFVKQEHVNKYDVTGTHFSVYVNEMEEESLDVTHGYDMPYDEKELSVEKQEMSRKDIHENHLKQLEGRMNKKNGPEFMIKNWSRIPKAVQQDINAVYRLLLETESYVHGIPVSEIHEHKLGNLDAVVDITAACLLMHILSPDVVVASSIHVGNGLVKCGQRILPVPAPATAFLLEQIPHYKGNIERELCTPTGAALIRYFVHQFGDIPPMRKVSVGYGIGKKDVGVLSAVRAVFGENG